MSTKHHLKKTDLVRVRRSIVGNLADNAWSDCVMSVKEALNEEQWDTTRGTMSVEIVLHNTDEVKLRTGRFVSHGSLGDNSVFNIGKRTAYVYLLEPYEIEDYDDLIKKMEAERASEQS